MTSNIGAFFFHGLLLLVYLGGFIAFEKPLAYFEIYFQKRGEGYAGRFEFLTYWNLIASFLITFLSCIVDISGNSSSSLRKIKDTLFAGIAFPYATSVFVSFWALMIIDRELVFPEAMGIHFPTWLTHVTHTLPFPAAVLEAYLIKHQYSRSGAMKATLAFGISYVVWTAYLQIYRNIWAYPILKLMDPFPRWCFQISFLLFAFVCYYLGEKLQNCFWERKSHSS